ncbi:cryptochrome/photolyase family protein [Natrialbaceae archaeon A-CW2]
MTIWALGDQLALEYGPLAEADPNHDRVLMVEATEFARRHRYHSQKLTLVFAAMRQFRDRLRREGFEVDYRQTATFENALDSHFASHPGDRLICMEPPSHGAGDRLQRLVESHGGTLERRHHEGFLCSRAAFDEWAGPDADSFRHESFYRWMRRKTGYLMDGDEPVGGEWNFDEDNRAFPRPEYAFSDPRRFQPDDLTQATLEWVESTFETWGEPEPFEWPVTRAQALDARDHFIAKRLPRFGPYQDAMVERSWAGEHALLSPALNLGLLHPRELIDPAIEAYEKGGVPLESVEGFLRQVLGWREFVRHVYRRAMPELATANALEANRELPSFYWDGETKMNCLETAVGRVRKRGYGHHIERLMLLSNLALLYGVEPQALNRWFHLAYVDAYHWVTTPNVIGMGLFASDALSTKPYAASANYVDRMSDYCADCPYDPDQTVGEQACPFNALYWDFLERNEDRLGDNHRMGLVYHHLQNKDETERTAIHERAERIRNRTRQGTI